MRALLRKDHLKNTMQWGKKVQKSNLEWTNFPPKKVLWEIMMTWEASNRLSIRINYLWIIKNRQDYILKLMKIVLEVLSFMINSLKSKDILKEVMCLWLIQTRKPIQSSWLLIQCEASCNWLLINMIF